MADAVVARSSACAGSNVWRSGSGTLARIHCWVLGGFRSGPGVSDCELDRTPANCGCGIPDASRNGQRGLRSPPDHTWAVQAAVLGRRSFRWRDFAPLHADLVADQPGVIGRIGFAWTACFRVVLRHGWTKRA